MLPSATLLSTGLVRLDKLAVFIGQLDGISSLPVEHEAPACPFPNQQAFTSITVDGHFLAPLVFDPWWKRAAVLAGAMPLFQFGLDDQEGA